MKIRFASFFQINEDSAFEIMKAAYDSGISKPTPPLPSLYKDQLFAHAATFLFQNRLF